MTQAGQIAGPVEYRAGDGPKMPIRKGPVEIEVGKAEATLSWSDGETNGVATLPLAEFKRYVSSGSIKLQA
jgi:hypothetical protein